MDFPWFSMFFHDFPSSSHWISIPGFPSQKMFRPSFAQKGAGAVSPTQQPQLDLLQSIRWESLWGAFFFDVFDVFDVGTFWDTAVFFGSLKTIFKSCKAAISYQKKVSVIHPQSIQLNPMKWRWNMELGQVQLPETLRVLTFGECSPAQ